MRLLHENSIPFDLTVAEEFRRALSAVVSSSARVALLVIVNIIIIVTIEIIREGG